MGINKKIILLLVWLSGCVGLQAANVVLEGCDFLTFDKYRGNCQKLKGNVRFRQDRTLMYCDSAYYYSDRNSFDAFGHVRVIQDSVTMVANKMFYDGNTKLMRIRENITMTSGNFRLTTQKLDYYRDRDYAYYDMGATITDPEFNLVSQVGYYYPKTKQAIFRRRVVLHSDDYQITTDTLFYNSKSGEANVNGKSIVINGDYTVNTSKAFMNQKTGLYKLYRRSSIINNSKTRSLIADTIYYNKINGTASAYGNIVYIDDSSHISAFGGYGHFEQKPVHSGIMARCPMVVEYSEKDSLYIHGDTMTLSSSANDSDRVVTGLHNVRFYRKDFQGKCELLTYKTVDSLMTMETNPILWSEDSQLKGDTVYLYLKNRRPDWLHITGSALVIQRDDSVNYNQLSGKELKGYFIKSSLRQVDIFGNAISVYFPKDKHGDLIGVNSCQGNSMSIFLDDKRKLQKIKMEPGTVGSMYPPFEAPKEVLFLKGFDWQDSIRPKKPMDIFLSNNQ